MHFSFSISERSGPSAREIAGTVTAAIVGLLNSAAKTEDSESPTSRIDAECTVYQITGAEADANPSGHRPRPPTPRLERPSNEVYVRLAAQPLAFLATAPGPSNLGKRRITKS
jgi:hypothetical protein